MERFVTTRALALGFVALNILDAFLTTHAMAAGSVLELNLILRPLIGSQTFWPVKIGLTLLFAGALLLFSSKYPKQVHNILATLSVCMIGVCLINSASLVLTHLLP